MVQPEYWCSLASDHFLILMSEFIGMMIGIDVVSQICYVTVGGERGSEVIVIDRYKRGKGLKNIKSSVA